MRHKFARSVLGAAVVVALVATACAPKTGSLSGEGQPEETPLKVVLWKGGGNEEANIAELNRKFETANPGVKVDFSYVKRGDYDAYNNTRFNGGTAADVVMVDSTLVKHWGRAGLLADLSDQPWVKTVDEQLIPFSGVNTKTYQLIQEVAPVGLYVNNDVLKTAGITAVPSDWPSFVASLEKLKAAGKKGLLVGNKGGWSSANLIQLSSVGTVLAANPQWNEQYNDGKVTFNPDWKEPLSRVQELVAKGLIDARAMMGIDPWGDGLDEFKSGQWAYTVQGAWQLADFTKGGKFDLSLVPFPANAAGRPVGYQFVGTGLAVNAKSKVPGVARKYLSFWAEPANLNRYLEAEAALTPLTEGKSPLPPQAQAFAVAKQEGRLRVAPPQYWEAPSGEDPFLSIGQKLFLDPDADQGKLLDELDKAYGAARR